MKTINSHIVLFALLYSWITQCLSFSPVRFPHPRQEQTRNTELCGSKKARPQANHEKWQPYFDSLSKYKDVNGSCNVKEEDDPGLFNWLEDQHRGYEALKAGRKTKVTRKRAIALEQLGAIPPDLMM